MAEMKKSASVRREKTKKSRAARFRLLPLVIFFCVLMLSVRVGVVWRNLVLPESADGQAAVAVTSVQAQSPAAAVETKTRSLSSKITQAVTDAEKNNRRQEEKGAGKSFSQSELEILQKLAQRREELDIRERGIEQKAGVLKAAEAQIDVKIAKLKELEASIKDLIGVYDEKERDRLNNLVKIYSAMKPKEAARLFNDMEMPLLVRVFEQMKEAKAAPILALMDSAKANALTAELANKRTLPGYDGPDMEQKK
ncbi:MAG: MotE family protein [Alphaproteobacteria bacterium]